MKFEDFNVDNFISSVNQECCCRPNLVKEIAECIRKGETRLLLVGSSGSGKTRLARSILQSLFSQFEEISQLDAYGVNERQSIQKINQKMKSNAILLEELSDFSMQMTPRDHRLTSCLSHLLQNTENGFIISTTRDSSNVDVSLLRNFPNKFYLKPLDLEGRILLFKSLPNNFSTPLVEQFRNLGSTADQESLMKHFASLNPSELLSSSPFIPDSTFSEVAGVHKIVTQLEFLILRPLIDSNLFREMGVRSPRGVLLTGPSGIGKSLIARTVGKVSRVSFFDISGVEIIAKEVGESEKRLHAIFERARASAPSIILFDDIDSIAPRRTFGESISEAADRLLTTLLVETDGLSGRDDGVTIIATTSRIDAIDPALTRPGRFDYIIEIPFPDENSRAEIFDLYTKGVPIEDIEKARKLVVDSTNGMTGANIEGIIREAAMISLREDIESKHISMDSFIKAVTSVKSAKTATVTPTNTTSSTTTNMSTFATGSRPNVGGPKKKRTWIK
ncbi:ATPase, AAA family protein [Tritrichomonas foetus]|uniref:ATPase, AAA family protein n=1 Tax=Tritrichomonas foetus TaxID=1144522 RepID=A0A1J4J115_9EUKA|nr:ATPase, AAA family protein [Tritrichomonas foetus]|eukprot:OHS93224.1 ATPase, AAA family protein [Tritrichomonas foetus]